MIQEKALQATINSAPKKATDSVAILETEFGNNLPGEIKPCQREEVRHILLGSPEAIRQVIHQLHVLNYAESLLWSPITTVGDELMVTKEQGEAMSLLRRPV